MIRLGLIGCGAWGWRYVPAALESANCRVTHVAGANLSGSFDAHLLGLQHVTSREWRSLLTAPVDAFIVATPPDTHEEICTTLLAAGRPVMVEKPVALSVRAATAIVDASRKTGATLLVNHQHLFAPAYEELRTRSAGWLERSAFGLGGGNGPLRDYSALWDYGPHDAAMLLGLVLDNAERLTVAASRRTAGRFTVRAKSPSLTARWSSWNDGNAKARSLIVTNRALSALVYDDTAPDGMKLCGDGLPIIVDPERPLQRAVRLFAEAVKTGKTDWRFGAFGAEVVRLLEEADRKIQEA